MKVLVTGAAGFIGYHLVKQLLNRGDEVIGLDNINAYYDVGLKYGRLQETGIQQSDVAYNSIVYSSKFPHYQFIQLNLEDRDNLFALFREYQFERVCHLAAQAGVRYSLTHPYTYIDCNIVGFMNMLEACRHFPVEHLTYASSSSVYGLNRQMPFSTHHHVDHPISLYAASKKSNELMAHTYSYLFHIPTTGLRFFTVYGPWGRPDMALFKFTRAILEDQPIEVYNQGDMKRDFTYVDDIVEGVKRVIDQQAEPDALWDAENPDPASSSAPYRIYNIGNSQPVHLMDFIHSLEKKLGKEARKQFKPLQPGDVPQTWADVSDLVTELDYHPKTPVEEGIAHFVDWYTQFYKVNL